MKNKRQNDIATLLMKEKMLKIKFLVKHFGVSIETIRRDIDALERRGVVKKVYGGIRPAADETLISELAEWNARSEHCRGEKLRITAKALELIPDGSTIVLDIGTTMHIMAQQLSAKRDLTILTCSMRSANELCRSNAHRVYMIGGQLHNSEQITTGTYARAFLENFASIDIFLCSADGVTLDAGTTEYLEPVVELKRQITSIVKNTVLLADHSKFGRKSMFKSLPLSSINTVVTDDRLGAEYIEGMNEAGVETIIVSVNDERRS